MGHRTGRADLPLHGGRVPAWLAGRMARLGRVVAEAVVLHEGRDAFLRRLSHPFWFQAFGAVMGMDWHSSGITTSVVGALKRGLAPVSGELGIYVCGGRGRHSRKTPDELAQVGEQTGVSGDALARASRLVAKVDSAAVQDGFDLYLHGFIATADGQWVVIQQGMNTAQKQARRYHWLSDEVGDFVDAPHAAIDGPGQGTIVNLTDRRAAAARRAQIELAAEGPDRVIDALSRVPAAALSPLRRPRPAPERAPLLPHLTMPAHHDVRASDVVGRRLRGNLAAAAARAPEDFPELLLVPGVGARTVQALALVGEIIHGAPSRFSDPARFSLAHGGKDGHPFPVPLKVYDRTLGYLRDAVDRAKLGNDDKLAALRRLDAEARRLEATADGPSFSEVVAEERRRSPDYGGRTVFGPARSRHSAGARPSSRAPRSESPAQLELDLSRRPA